MIDKTLINRLTELASKEKKSKAFRSRVRIKGNVIAKETTIKGNKILTIRKGQVELRFTVLKSHKDRFSLAEKLTVGRSVSAVGIPKLRMIICVSLKLLEKRDCTREANKITMIRAKFGGAALNKVKKAVDSEKEKKYGTK